MHFGGFLIFHLADNKSFNSYQVLSMLHSQNFSVSPVSVVAENATEHALCSFTLPCYTSTPLISTILTLIIWLSHYLIGVWLARAMPPFIRTTAAGRRNITQHSAVRRASAVTCNSPDLFLDYIMALADTVDSDQSLPQWPLFESSLLDIDAINKLELYNERICKNSVTHLTTIALLQERIKLKSLEDEDLKEKILLSEQTLGISKTKLSEQVIKSTLYDIKKIFRQEDVSSPFVPTMTALFKPMPFFAQLLGTETVATWYKVFLFLYWFVNSAVAQMLLATVFEIGLSVSLSYT